MGFFDKQSIVCNSPQHTLPRGAQHTRHSWLAVLCRCRLLFESQCPGLGMSLQPGLVLNTVLCLSPLTQSSWTVSWSAVSCSHGARLCARVLARALVILKETGD